VSVTAIILAGGASRRMGVDKLTLIRSLHEQTAALAGAPETILAYVVRVCMQTADDIMVQDTPDARHGNLIAGGANVRWVADTRAHEGPLHALAQGFTALPPATTSVLVVAGDLPGITATVLHTLQAALATSGNDIDGVCIVRDNRCQPLLACYRPRVYTHLAAAVVDGERRLMNALSHARLTTFSANEAGWPAWWTTPVHTPAAYEAWLQYQKEATL